MKIREKMMKKLLALSLGVLCAFSIAACGTGAPKEEVNAHVHKLMKTSAKAASCTREGNVDYWTCRTCDKIYSDADATTEITLEDTVVKTLPHDLKKVDGREKTCAQSGRKTYWECEVCEGYFADEKGSEKLSKVDVFLGYGEHELVHHAEIPVNGKENGVKEYWNCPVCGLYFADSEATTRIDEDDLILYSVENIPDFIVEVETGREPVVLQLSDTQIIDAGQIRPGRDGVDSVFWATDQVEERCYDYVTETIEAVNPDLILLTGDIIYGEFDDNGSVWTSFIAFMESFEIPWAPVFGNHDNESKMGVDWQCEQLENAEYCLFEQKTLTGNGNYSVGIMQGGELKRIFYMLDSNGCGNASAESLANGHTKNNFVGFGDDQIAWYTEQISHLKEVSPDTKISFAYHIQQAIFATAYAKYGFNQGEKYQDINIDRLEDKAEGDFGYIGRQLKGPWDTNFTVWNAMKRMGVDSIFVGHEHCNSASVVYDGVRFQFGQKSSEYDRFNCVDAEGNITGGYSKTGTSLIGGSVIVLSEEDGSISNAYIYLCKDAGGDIDWDQFKEYEVGGLKKEDGVFYGDGAVTFISTAFDETTNAYSIYADNQGKVYIAPSLLRGKTTVTFSVYVPSGFSDLAGMGPFAIRLKPDDGNAAGIAGVLNASGKYYIDYDVDSVDAAKVVPDTWQTFTVDISDIADTCTEFAFLVAKGNTIYLKDVTIS